MSKVIVIGAGASGVIAALKASEKNEVILVDSNDKIGKKILLTGNGRCNYWNEFISLDKYNTDNQEKLESILNHKEETFDYLLKLGIYPKKKNEYFYPASNQAFSVREIFDSELKKRNIKIITNFKVDNIKKLNNGFEIINNEEKLICDKLIIATGSKAYPKTGSEGFFFEMADSFDLKMNPVLPSLTSLKTDDTLFKDLSGIRTDAKVSLYIDNTFIKEDEGEVQFTDNGISGICVFNISSNASKALYLNKNVEVRINLLPYLNEDFISFMEKRNKLIPNHTIYELFESIFNYKLINVLFKKTKISFNAHWESLTSKEKELLKDNITNFYVKIIDTGSFDKAQVCTGGISLDEINESMEINKIPDLYLVGEVLDVDGICGGFNLAFAFITGYIAGKDI